MKKVVITLTAIAVPFLTSCGTGGTKGPSNLHMCEKLSTLEKSFAERLHPLNQKVFCQELTYSQRKEAMYLARHGDFEYGRTKKFSPDEAVEKVSNKRLRGKSFRRACQQ